MKQDVLKLIAFILLTGSIGYIYGQEGALYNDDISMLRFAVRTGIALVVLAFDTWLINYIDWKEEIY